MGGKVWNLNFNTVNKIYTYQVTRQDCTPPPRQANGLVSGTYRDVPAGGRESVSKKRRATSCFRSHRGPLVYYTRGKEPMGGYVRSFGSGLVDHGGYHNRRLASQGYSTTEWQR